MILSQAHQSFVVLVGQIWDSYMRLVNLRFRFELVCVMQPDVIRTPRQKRGQRQNHQYVRSDLLMNQAIFVQGWRIQHLERLSIRELWSLSWANAITSVTILYAHTNIWTKKYYH